MVSGKSDENFGAGCRRRILRGVRMASAPLFSRFTQDSRRLPDICRISREDEEGT